MRVEEPTLSIVAIRLRVVSFSGASDSIFQKELLMAVSDAQGGAKDATFDFVIRSA